MSERLWVEPITNFGGNKIFQPEAVYAPHSETELLDIMRANRGKRIRAIGRLHSWSDAPVCEEILLDLKHLNSVAIHADESASIVEVGAGCQIKRLIDELNVRGFTLPSMGLIMQQTIAGATATGTHGSGRHSLSHYIEAVRIANFDPTTGEPIIRVIEGGDDLRAARCSLGCLGIVTSVRLAIREQYNIQEHFASYDQVDEVLEQENEYELQQFFLLPWWWKFFAQHRFETRSTRSWSAPLYRFYWRVGTDLVLHLVIRLLARQLPAFCTKFYYRWILPYIFPMNWRVVDRSDRQLTMKHELFQHIEIEIFVTRSRLTSAVEYIVWLLRHLSGENAESQESFRNPLQEAGHWDSVLQSRGTYQHHYPICFRKVLPDDTLISMAAGLDEPCYAISFISYVRPADRASFLRFAELLAQTAATLFDARPHWGKVCPLSTKELNRLYPRLRDFVAICDRMDPEGWFRNEWTATVLGILSK